MFSFYSLPSSVLKHEKHTKLHAAYCYYYFANKTPVQQLISDALAPRQAAAGHGGRPLTPHDSSRRRWSSPSATSLTSSTRSTSSTTTACSRQAPRPAPRTHTSLRPSLLLDLLPGEPRRPRHLCCPAAAAPRPPPLRGRTPPSAAAQELKFGIGDGHLQYYLYNWRCPTVVAREIGLVLL